MECCFLGMREGNSSAMGTILWLLAVALVLGGIYVLVARRDILFGVILIIAGLLVGPGGVSLFG